MSLLAPTDSDLAAWFDLVKSALPRERIDAFMALSNLRQALEQSRASSSVVFSELVRLKAVVAGAKPAPVAPRLQLVREETP